MLENTKIKYIERLPVCDVCHCSQPFYRIDTEDKQCVLICVECADKERIHEKL